LTRSSAHNRTIGKPNVKSNLFSRRTFVRDSAYFFTANMEGPALLNIMLAASLFPFWNIN